VKLQIAIPALNEEQSIESIIRRSLDARSYICNNSPIREVEIMVVSDGSTDRTAEIASWYRDQIGLIVFQENKGYGAAIKEAWRRSDADILGFLDADGTCEPEFFAPLCERLINDRADVVLGCRLHGKSHMPLMRRIGNTIFAGILTVFASNRVRDTASGMRVVRRTALLNLFPLPDGLHFTPAMSARSMLSDKVKITEIDMPYEERAGESKLHVAKDGLRFLKVILETAFLYRPSRLFGILGLLFLLIATGLMIEPSVYYLEHRSLLAWMIYRFLVSDLCGIAACLLFCASYLTDRIVSIALSGEVRARDRDWKSRFFQSSWFWIVPLLFIGMGVALVISSVIERVLTGGTYEHWSRYVAMTFWISIALVLSVARIIDYCLSMVADRLYYMHVLLPAELPFSPATIARPLDTVTELGDPCYRAKAANIWKEDTKFFNSSEDHGGTQY
jgi:glycosyltransferase involved in cell wall biosynthesis